jgi:deferrochelatase/peroxidase EfeB
MTGNISIHVKGETQSLCFDAIKLTLKKLPKDTYSVIHEIYGFKYRD